MKHLPETSIYPVLQELLILAQQLVIKEFYEAKKVIEDASLLIKSFTDDLFCNCIFYHHYHLPCIHLWWYEMLYKVFNEQAWQNWINKFNNTGFDIYETIKEIDVNHDFTYKASVADQKLHICEILDSLKNAFFRM